ncbi:MAG: T9SS type A sorting domain-containing protein, partial [Bacteroidota bacterium]
GQSIDAEIVASGGDTINHMAFNDNFQEKLFYATGSKNNNWNWAVTQLDTGTSRIHSVSTALTTSNEPVVAYAGGDNLDLRIAQHMGGTWHYQIVDSARNVGFTDMEISPGDTIHIVYYDDNEDCLKYAWRHASDSAWFYDYVDCGNQPVGLYPSLELDAQEQPAVAYFDEYAQNLKYAVRNPATRAWNIDSVYDAGASAVGKFVSLELGPGDQPMLAFLEEQSTSIYYAERNLAGLWDVTVVDSLPVSNIGRPIDLEVDGFGNPWIAYNFYTNFDKVKLVRRDSATWNEVAVSSTGRIANAFDFAILGGDLYITGKKNEVQNSGVGMLYAGGGLFVEAPEPTLLSETTEILNYPNPFSSGTTFRIESEKAQVLSLHVYDLYGKKVATVLEERKLSAGNHEFYYDANGLAPGIYLYEVTDGISRMVHKLVISN